MAGKLRGLTLLRNNSENVDQNSQHKLQNSYCLQQAEISFDTTIDAISFESNDTLNASEVIILPGFIDIHVHGGGGADTMDSAIDNAMYSAVDNADSVEAIQTLASFHLKHGTTTIYPTTITNPWQNIVLALQAIKTMSQTQLADESKQLHTLPSIPGAHLEGPFISPHRLGAQPAHAILPTFEKVQNLIELDVIKLLTIAPELPQALEVALEFAKAECRISIGHTTASYNQIFPFVQTVREHGGVIGYTHLFNAMGGMTGREPNVLGTALADSESYAEIILDTHHVHPASFLAAFNAKPDNLSLITDAMRACGMGDGKSELGGQEVYIQDGMAKMADGTLAGSLLTMDTAFKNAIAAGLSIEEASRLASTTPAKYMGLTDRGTLDIGKRADIIVMNKEFDIIKVYVKGKKLYG